MQKLNLAVKVQLHVAGYRIHKKLICPEHFADDMKRRLFQQDDLFKRDNSVGAAAVLLKLIAAFPESCTGSQSFLS